MKYDAVVCVGPHHKKISRMAINSLRLFSEPRKIYVITAASNFDHFVGWNGEGASVEMVDEDKLIDGVNFLIIKEYFVRRGADPARAGWYFQQFLKMAICQYPDIADHYLIWDSDTIMLQSFPFFDQRGKPLVNPTNRYHQPYFDLVENLLGFPRLVDFSFISEHLMVRNSYMRELIEKARTVGNTGEWVFNILDLVKDDNLSEAGFSEFETYGNFIHRYFPESYVVRNLRSLRSGAKRTGPLPGSRDLYRLSRKYAYVSFEMWTRPERMKSLLWKAEAWLDHALTLPGALFSKKIAARLRAIDELFG